MRGLLWKLLRWFLFSFDAETAHRITVRLVRMGLRVGEAPLRWVSGAPSTARPDAGSAVVVLGMEFRSRVGLAAGFDKDAEIVRALPALGFGFAEIGTVTPRPQPGNPRPRLFRDPERSSLFNRMGFNGIGATLVAARLGEARPRLPSGFRIGLNIGKNKDTPLEEAPSDYVRAVAPFDGLADYVVINVSSPNTPGLRSLQAVEALRPIVEGVNSRITGWSKRPPLLLKLAPELSRDELAEIVPACEAWGIDGWVLTNTLGGKWKDGVAGGWSGGCLTERARQALLDARGLTRKPIVSVGGILSAEEAAARVSAGADLVQLYSGWIYGGPTLPAEVARRLRLP